MKSHTTYSRRLRAFMQRGFASSQHVSRGQVELAGSRVLHRLRGEPMWHSEAPLFDADPARHVRRLPRIVAMSAAAALALAVVGAALCSTARKR
jgi:hypothetical protein